MVFAFAKIVRKKKFNVSDFHSFVRELLSDEIINLNTKRLKNHKQMIVTDTYNI